ARARQPDDEDRIRARVPPGAAGGEELARADLDLLLGVGLDQLRAITALGALELIPQLVVAEGLGVFAAILERLAERKTQVIPIGEHGRRRRERGTHL